MELQGPRAASVLFWQRVELHQDHLFALAGEGLLGRVLVDAVGSLIRRATPARDHARQSLSVHCRKYAVHLDLLLVLRLARSPFCLHTLLALDVGNSQAGLRDDEVLRLRAFAHSFQQAIGDLVGGVDQRALNNAVRPAI